MVEAARLGGLEKLPDRPSGRDLRQGMVIILMIYMCCDIFAKEMKR